MVLAALLVLDRVGVWAAERDVGKRLQTDAHTSTTPSVTIHGFPFLTQLASGSFDDVDINMHGLEAGHVHITRLTVQVHDAHVSMGDVISQRSTRIHVDRATAQLLITYDDIAQFVPAQIRTRTTIVRTLIRTVSIAGADTISLGTQFGDIPLPIPGLPFGIRLTGAKATQAGVVVDGEARGLVVGS